MGRTFKPGPAPGATRPKPKPRAVAVRAPAAVASAQQPGLPAWMEGTTREELIGLSRDGRKLLWSTGQVRPITRFPRTASGFIAGGKYILDWKGHRITAHCSPTFEGQVEVQIMCGGGISFLPLDVVEGFLCGMVVEDPVASARLLARMQGLHAFLEARNDTPSRQRGSIFDDAQTKPKRKGRTTRSIPQVMAEGRCS